MRSILQKLNRNILDPDTRKKGITYAYMVFTSFLLIHQIYAALYQKTVLNGGKQLVIPMLLFAAAGFFLGRLWKDKLFWVFLALFILKAVRTWMFGSYAFEVSGSYFVLSAYAYFGVYAVARVIPKDSWRSFLSVHCFCWTVAALVFAVFGLRVAFTGVPVPNLGTEYFTIDMHRLALIYQPVTSGIVLSICMSFTVLGCFLTKKGILRLFYVLVSLVLFFTASLTGTRTAYILSGANMALLLYIPLSNLLKPGKTKGFFRNSAKYVLLFLSFLIVTGLIAYLQSQTMRLMDYMQVRGGLLVSTAHAESETVLGEINQRGFVISSDPDDMFNGRYVLWGNVLEVLFENAENFFLGQSVFNTMVPVYEIRYELGLRYFYHCHNIYLQHFLENGLPAFLLYISFILTFLFHAIRVLTNRDLPVWQRLLPVTAILCALEGMIDCTCHVNFGYPQMTLLYLLAGFTITLSRESKKNA